MKGGGTWQDPGLRRMCNKHWLIFTCLPKELVSSSKAGALTCIFYYFLKVKIISPWLVWLSGLNASLPTKGSWVQFPVMAHTWVAGQVPSRGRVRGNHTSMFLSVFPSLHLSLKINNIFKIKKKLFNRFHGRIRHWRLTLMLATNNHSVTSTKLLTLSLTFLVC